MKKFWLFMLVCVSGFSALAGTDIGFDAFYSDPGGIGVWGWVIIAVSAVAIAAAVYFTAGGAAAAAPAWMQAVGAWIGGTVYGLHGAAAVNAGLALLGGGAVSAGGLGIKGGIVLLTILASTSTDIAIEYSVDTASAYFNNKAFLEDSRKMSTLPIPINAEGSAAYKRNLEWLKAEKEKFYGKDKEFNVNDDEFQCILKEAAAIFGVDMRETSDAEAKVKDLTFLSILYFQMSDYKNAFKYSGEATRFASSQGKNASLASFVYATSYLYSKSASANRQIQNEYLVPALLCEGGNRFTPIAIAVYLDRLMYRIHSGASDPTEAEFLLRLLAEPAFEDNAAKCVPVFTMRILQEIKRSQKDIEILAKCKNVDFLRGHDAGRVVDTRYGNFVELRKILSRLIPYVEKYESTFEKDYPLTSQNLILQLEGMQGKESELKELITELKGDLSPKHEDSSPWFWPW